MLRLLKKVMEPPPNALHLFLTWLQARNQVSKEINNNQVNEMPSNIFELHQRIINFHLKCWRNYIYTDLKWNADAITLALRQSSRYPVVFEVCLSVGIRSYVIMGFNYLYEANEL